MKKIWWCGVALVGALASSGVAAQPYLGVGGGVGHVDFDCALSGCDRNGPAFKLLGGYEFASGWAVEVAYLGHESGELLFEEFDSRLWILNAAFRFRPGSNLGLVARVGAAHVSTDHEVWLGSTRSTRDSVVSPYAGLGLTYAFGKTFMFELAGDYSRGKVDGQKAGISAFTAGVRINF